MEDVMHSRGFSTSAGVSVLALAALLALPFVARAEVYELDGAHTSPTFQVRHFFTQVTGRFDAVQGTVNWNHEDPTRSSVTLRIDVTSVNTGNEKRDQHLESADFFDAANHPTLVFESTRIEPSEAADRWIVHGDLTIRGVTRSVAIDLEVVGFGDMGAMGVRGGFVARTKINRQDFGVSWSRKLDNGGVVLGDEVSIEVPVEVVKKTS